MNPTLPSEQTTMAAHCTSCGKCVRPCDFLQQNGTPKSIALRGSNDADLLSAYGCSLCGLCDAVCPEALSPSALFLSMRQEAARRGLTDLKRYRPWLIYEKLGSTTPFKRSVIPKDCTTVLFPGCSFPGTRPDSLIDLFGRLRQLDPTAGLVLDCCGKISHDLGLSERFQKIFGNLAQRLENKGITRIVTTCPGCSKIFRKHGGGFEVVSIYELLEGQGSWVMGQNAISPLAPCPLTPDPVVIHDPCPARFDTAQQQAVRQLVLTLGFQIEELPQNRRLTRCCGQGGMVDGCVPGSSVKEASRIAASASGVPVITSCASCAETICPHGPTTHIADLLTGQSNFSTMPVSSARRWLNRLKLRFTRFT